MEGDNAGRLRAFVELTRPGNVALAAIGALVGGLAAAGEDAHVDALLAAMACAALGVAGGNALNDAFDARIDRTAHPRRPIPQGLVQAHEASWLGGTLIMAALLAALLANFWVLLLALLLAGNLLLYEFFLKGRVFVGSLFVSYNTGALFVLGGLASLSTAAQYDATTLAVLPFDERILAPIAMGLLALLLNLAREVYKAAEDAPHDRNARETLAVRFGVDNARRIGGLITLLVIPLAVVPWWLGLFPDVYLQAVLPLLVLLLVVPFLQSPARARALLKIGMFLGLVPFLAASLI